MAPTTKQAISKAQGAKRRYHEVDEDLKESAPKATKSSFASKSGKPSKKVTLVTPSDDDEESDDEIAAQASNSIRNKLAKKGVQVENSDSESDQEQDEAANRNAPIVDIVRLPSSKDDTAVRARLDAASKRRAARQGATDKGVVYVGRVPAGFYEPQMQAYFGQFGTVAQLRLSRNPKTGAPRHYGFVEFEDQEVAKIVAETMDNYLIMGHLLQVKVIPSDEVHPDLFKGSRKYYRFIGKSKREIEDGRIQREHERHDRPRTTEEQNKTDQALLKRQEQRREKLKSNGIDYDFPGCKFGPCFYAGAR